MDQTLIRLFFAALALACGAGVVASLVRGKTLLPEREGPALVADRHKNPGLYWFMVVGLGLVGALFLWAAVAYRSAPAPARLTASPGRLTFALEAGAACCLRPSGMANAPGRT